MQFADALGSGGAVKAPPPIRRRRWRLWLLKMLLLRVFWISASSR
jgi:hypothetical protein